MTSSEEMGDLFDNGTSDNTGILCPKCQVKTDYREWLDREGGYLMKRVCENCGNTYTYPKDAGVGSLYERFVYEAKCIGHTLMVLTQDDRNPEYHTIVTVICPIHKKEVSYELPVN